MAPSQVLRAMQPLRSSTVRSTLSLSSKSPAALQCNRPTFPSRRLITSAPRTVSQQQEETKSSVRPSAEPPSLREYPYTLKKGTVVSVGRMDRCVRVEHRHNVWDDFLRKNYPKVTTFMVSDPQNSLREGDVIEFSSGYPKSRRVHHVVERIIAPFGQTIKDRPAVLSREERNAIRVEKRVAKAARREQRRLESGATQSQTPVHGQEHIGRIRRLVLERTAESSANVGVSA
ncbi:uncharacterized protein DSM5745_09608 [Aspergillus mulundensis]|uniref:Nucleic acid-binding protein n=1 Tax=Aspergillus mulundensis TaxID=1810919 RepID=A0A3D8QVT3_9EURO|nr:Uncharacterized protein DSM5745_09608 [Aspergillus mulundensis]RDW65869.1 Uncharacterized protein DSM5745_09608 [Aspergillus mulundensis]